MHMLLGIFECTLGGATACGDGLLLLQDPRLVDFKRDWATALGEQLEYR